MAGTVMVVTHAALSTVTVTVVLGALVDTITGTDVVTSAQTGVRYVSKLTNAEVIYELPSISIDKVCLEELFH